MSVPALFDLTGKTAFLTGSTQGIGLALARGLAGAGAAVVLNGRDPAKLETAVAELRAAGHAASGHAFDVADPEAVERAVPGLGPVDILVNNAGIHRRYPLTELSVAHWHEVIATNLNAAFYVSRLVARGMIERRRGKIVNICSLMSEVGRPTTGPYTAAKGGLKQLTKAMCVEWAPHGIQVNGIGPGYIATPLNKPLMENPEFDAWVKRRTPAGRWARPEELVGACVFLASAASDFVNGHILYVDGGMLASL